MKTTAFVFMRISLYLGVSCMLNALQYNIKAISILSICAIVTLEEDVRFYILNL